MARFFNKFMNSGLTQSLALPIILSTLLVVFSTVSAGAEDNLPPLKLAIHPYLPATELVTRFTPLAKEIEKQLKRPVHLMVAKDYNEHIEWVGRDQVDVAYMGPVSYVEMVARFGQKNLLARHEVNGQPVFYGMIFTGKNSDIRSIKDLEGKTVAFGRKKSTMSYIVPCYMLIPAGVQLSDLKDYMFVGSHNDVVFSVLMGDADVGAVKEEVFDQYKDRGLKLLARSPSVSEHVFVASNKPAPMLIDRIQRILLGISGEQNIQSILAPLKDGTTGLLPVTDSDYDNLRMMMKTVLPAEKDSGQ